MPFEVKLVPTNGGPTLELPKGSTILGRSPKFGITDRRVSRKHAQVLVSQETSSVTLMSLGVNPSFLQRGASKTVIPKGELKMLENNDVISLLEGEVSFRVLISPDEEEEEEQEPQTEFDQDATQPNMDNYDYLLLQTAEDPAAGGAPLPVSPVKRQREHSSPRPKKGGANKRARIAPKRLALEDSQDSQNSENSSENISGLKGMEIDPGELKIMNKVGVGSCGEVYEALWKGTRVAVKKIFRTLIHSDSFNEFKAEALILRNLRHPNVVLFMGTCTRRDEMSIITEFMSRGNLRDVLNDESVDLSWELILKIASDAAQGMNYLHTYQPPIIHRDLKSHNLLVDENYNVKVTDFGLAKSMTNDKAMTFCGTMPWTAPEIFSNAGYTTKADVYSYGIVLWELFTREEPYKDMHKPQIIIGVSKDGLRPVIPTACPPQLAELMRDCWKEDPAQRPSFSEILERLRTMQPPPPAFKHTFSTSDLNPLTLTESFKHATTREVALMHTWQIEGSELEFGVEVGQGASSHVFKGKYRGQDVAIKVLKERVDGKHLEEFKKEFAIMSDMRSPRVVFFYGAVTHPHLAIVTEFFSKGSLYDVMCNSNLNFDWRLLLRLSIEAAKSLNALHCWRPQILHRDLKSPNLLVDSNWNVKIADFGLSRFKTQANEASLAQLKGTYAYTAPETYLGATYTPKSDVYSFGIVLWELVMRKLTGNYQRPFSEYKNLKFDFQIIVQTAKKGLRPTLPSSCPPHWAELIQRCWDVQEDKRPTMAEVVGNLKAIKKLYKPQDEEQLQDIKTKLHEDHSSTTASSEEGPSTTTATSSKQQKEKEKEKEIETETETSALSSTPTAMQEPNSQEVLVKE